MVIDVKAISGAIFRASDCYSNWKRGRSGPEKHILFLARLQFWYRGRKRGQWPGLRPAWPEQKGEHK